MYKIYRLEVMNRVDYLLNKGNGCPLLSNWWLIQAFCFWMSMSAVVLSFLKYLLYLFLIISGKPLAKYRPTSGLDARAAAIVMRGMKRIALSGRAVCATIHQPSIAIFNAFDALLLLKRGGETVFFGDLGENSVNLIQYLERYEATPRISVGENPSSWMLTCIGAGSSGSNKKPFDYAGSYAQSKLHAQCLERIDQICSKAAEENRISFPSEYATSLGTQSITVLKKALKVYYRSPTYNVTRVTVSAIGK